MRVTDVVPGCEARLPMPQVLPDSHDGRFIVTGDEQFSAAELARARELLKATNISTMCVRGASLRVNVSRRCRVPFLVSEGAKTRSARR